jgi:hypothetical protein
MPLRAKVPKFAALEEYRRFRGSIKGEILRFSSFRPLALPMQIEPPFSQA